MVCSYTENRKKVNLLMINCTAGGTQSYDSRRCCAAQPPRRTSVVNPADTLELAVYAPDGGWLGESDNRDSTSERSTLLSR